MGLHVLGHMQGAVALHMSSTVLTFAHRELYLSMTAFTCASWPFCMSAMLLRSFRLCVVHSLSSLLSTDCKYSSLDTVPYFADAAMYPSGLESFCNSPHLPKTSGLWSAADKTLASESFPEEQAGLCADRRQPACSASGLL